MLSLGLRHAGVLAANACDFKLEIYLPHIHGISARGAASKSKFAAASQ
jgi:hypothetical protein